MAIMKFLRRIIPVALLLGLSACGGSGGGLGNIFGGNPSGSECQTGTAQELAAPQAFTTASNVNQVTIVANGNVNALYQNYQNWYIYLTDSFGDRIQGAQLNLVADPGGPHPYPSDFYYSSQLPQTLPSGVTWNVFLTEFNNSNGCAAVPMAGFST
jgi:hypothetical protein